MDVWRFIQVLCIIAFANANSDPMDKPQFDIFDESKHVPGEPLCPLDFQNAETVNDDPPPNDRENSDPIEIAGLFEGDIILSASAIKEGSNNPFESPNKNGIIYEKQKWPGGVIPYFISSEFNAVERSVIAKAIGEYHQKTCIKFRPRTTETDYIHITKGDGCSSLVGRNGGVQPVSLGEGCVFVGIAIHEFMHATGFWHEQSRYDRDDFVSVYFNNVQPGMEFNFRKYNWNYIQNLSAPYDLSSIMHYGSYAFSKDRKSVTILPKNPNLKIGQRDNFSKIDILKINRLYNCNMENNTKPTPSPATPKPIGRNKCEDNHQNCEYWAKKGECSTNGTWMLVNCRKSCNQCNMPCRDLNQYCGVWAKKGDCTKSNQRDYMKSYCTKSCSRCRSKPNSVGSKPVSSTSKPKTTPPPKSTPSTLPPSSNIHLECEDKEKFCAYWASTGECTKNPRFMGKYCPKSCQIC